VHNPNPDRNRHGQSIGIRHRYPQADPNARAQPVSGGGIGQRCGSQRGSIGGRQRSRCLVRQSDREPVTQHEWVSRREPLSDRLQVVARLASGPRD
jgi:hypothetical protein